MIRTSLRRVLALALLLPLPADPADPPRFTDVTAASGLSFLHRTGAQGGWHYIETMGSGCALFDYDRDGDLDLYLVNGANLPGQPPEGTNALYRNDTAAGEIRFTEVAQAGIPGRGYGMGCAAADYDNDGFIDLYVTGYPEGLLYHNDGNGTFTEVTRRAGVAVAGWSSGAAFFDHDRDGDLDLFVVRYLTYDLTQEPVCRSGGLRTYCGPDRFEGAHDVLFRNDGDGTFTDVTRQVGIPVSPPGKGLGVVPLDSDGDGDTDLYVANDTTPNFLYRNNGDSTFTEVGATAGVAISASGRPHAGMGVDAGDVDGDGAPDLIVTNFSYEPNSLYRNLGSGLFEDATEAASLSGPSTMPLGFGTHLFDFDNDGDLDLFVANGHIYPNVASYSPAETYAQLNQLFRNDGGVFAEVTEAAGFTVPAVSRGSAVGDLDGDGDLDLVVSASGDRPRVYRNDGGNRNHWLAVRLVGGNRPHPPPNPLPLPREREGETGRGGSRTAPTKMGEGEVRLSNRDGLGARVSVTAGGRTQMCEARSQSSYLSTSDVRLHFGLGLADRVERLEVHWPGGRTQTFQDIRADQILVIEERR